MHARVTTLQLDPGRIDEAVRQVREEEVPGWQRIPGFKGFTLMADRDSGKVVGTSYWASREEMDASAETVKDSRRRAAEAGGASGAPGVETFEIAFDTWG